MLEVGKPFVPGRDSLRASVEYSFRSGQHRLVLCFYNLDGQLVEAVQQGECEFALVVYHEVIFLLYRFGESMAWSDVPFNWHSAPEAQRELPAKTESVESRASLQIILVDADRNVVRALRTVALSPKFVAALETATREQAEGAWHALRYDLRITEAYQTWPKAAAMLQQAIEKCQGGE